MRDAFPARFDDLWLTLENYSIGADELVAGGGNRAGHTARFDASLQRFGWGKRNITIEKFVDGRPIHRTRGHEIDMFGAGPGGAPDPYPGVGVEMEWNNKDPFFDRDLLNFQALHREGALAVGVIVTRGPDLQQIIGPTIYGTSRSPKFGRSTTHWDKLVPRVELGGGGECPLILIGIQPERIDGFEPIVQAYSDRRPITRGDTLEA
nr:BglII/BstYI family type II restriction endonuclease [Ornithinimicrobium sp. HY1793]